MCCLHSMRLSDGSAVMEIATLILPFGAVTAVCMAAQFHVYRKMPNIWIIAAFLVSYLISSGLTRQYGVTDNLKEMLWLGISMIVIYGSSYMYEPDEMKQEFRILAWVWVAYCTSSQIWSACPWSYGEEGIRSDPERQQKWSV